MTVLMRSAAQSAQVESIFDAFLGVGRVVKLAVLVVLVAVGGWWGWKGSATQWWSARRGVSGAVRVVGGAMKAVEVMEVVGGWVGGLVGLWVGRVGGRRQSPASDLPPSDYKGPHHTYTYTTPAPTARLHPLNTLTLHLICVAHNCTGLSHAHPLHTVTTTALTPLPRCTSFTLAPS